MLYSNHKNTSEIIISYVMRNEQWLCKFKNNTKIGAHEMPILMQNQQNGRITQMLKLCLAVVYRKKRIVFQADPDSQGEIPVFLSSSIIPVYIYNQLLHAALIRKQRSKHHMMHCYGNTPHKFYLCLYWYIIQSD